MNLLVRFALEKAGQSDRITHLQRQLGYERVRLEPIDMLGIGQIQLTYGPVEGAQPTRARSLTERRRQDVDLILLNVQLFQLR